MSSEQNRFLTRSTTIEVGTVACLSVALPLIVVGPILRVINSGWSSGDMLSTYVNAENWGGFGCRRLSP